MVRCIVIGTSLSGKTTTLKYLRSNSDVPTIEMDDELTRKNNGKYPEDTKIKHNIIAPQVIKELLKLDNIIFFTNTDYFTASDLKLAKDRGFKVVQLKLGLVQLKKRNELRTKEEGRDDWSKWLKGMLQYQKEIRENGFVDKIISTNQPPEKVAKELLVFLNI